jgi:hypothetical protein
MICNYRTKNISFDLLDVNQARDFRSLKTYLEAQGPPYYKNTENPDKKEFHYFCCDSPILITELPGKADIEIVSPRFSSLEHMKSKIGNILNRIIT